jgi:signal transduction histidine kinase
MRIKQVFQNIYSNALKFSPENEIIYTDISISNGFLVIGITDSGAGVDESERELIFEKFVQSERTKTGAGGIGLGLAICREIVLGHGGKIYVEDNSTGRGSRFVVELPISGN